MEYKGILRRIPVQKMIPLHYKNSPFTSADFVKHLESLFNYDYFCEGDQEIVQYEFTSLNPSRKMAFPTFLLVQTDRDMNIEYMITSKHLSSPIVGELHWLYPEEV